MKHTVAPIVALVMFFSSGLSAAHGQVYIAGVPDWNQPVVTDANLPDPGPINLINNPAPNSPVNAWCTPAATGNIAGYYRDLGVTGAIADAPVFPSTSVRPAVDWRDETLDTLTPPPFRLDIGWYMNTNNIGDPVGVPTVGPMTGTHYANIEPGVRHYLTVAGLLPPTQVVTFTDSANPSVAGLDTSGVVAPRTVPMAYQRIVNEIDADQPLLLHVSHWNLILRNVNRGGGPGPAAAAELTDYDDAQWGPHNPLGPGEEIYSDDIGHTATIVGYWNGGAGPVPGHPFSGLGNVGSTPDAVIVHDNTDGTLAGPPTSALPLVLPFSAGEGNPGLNVPWVMHTEISQVPEPATLSLLALGGLALIRRPKR